MIEKIFKAYDVRATYPSPLNEDAAWKVGHATALFLKRNRQSNPEPKVTLKRTRSSSAADMRPTLAVARRRARGRHSGRSG
jgi:phosphomannomutase